MAAAAPPYTDQWKQVRSTIDKFDTLIYEYTSTVLSVAVSIIASVGALVGTLMGDSLSATIREGMAGIVVLLGALAIAILANALVAARINFDLMDRAIQTGMAIEVILFPANPDLRLTHNIELAKNCRAQKRVRTFTYVSIMVVVAVIVGLSAASIALLR